MPRYLQASHIQSVYCLNHSHSTLPTSLLPSRITFSHPPPVIMLSLTINTPKPLFLSTPFLPPPPPPPPPPLNPHKPPKPLSVSALILPPSSSTSKTQQKVYQPFRPPPSPLPSKYRNLDTNARLEILTNRLGLWFEYAPLITSLIQEGFISTTLEEITGIPSLEQNSLVVAAQVRDSLVESTDEETVSYFDIPGAPEILYEIRILNTTQRALAARFIIEHGFEGKKAEELARSMKDFPRRYGERGWENFDGNLPGDCLAFMYFRQGHEHKSASSPELSMAAWERALEMAETEKAKRIILEDLEGKDGEGDEGGIGTDDLVRVPVVRMAIGEVAESSVVVVLPVCRAEEREIAVEEAPWESGMGGEFGMVQAEKPWSRWVVLPGWAPVAVLKRGGVAVAFPKARGVLPWRSRRRDADEEILVVVDREEKEVAADEGFHLVVSGGNGSGEEGLKVERGAKLKEMGVEKSLGTVVLVVRPPREEEDQLADIEWD
ncbi:UNVERIFIED_CONTAM: Rubisco accumulation factor 1.1, chloroplastic [Sesamum calycinum]|uniref:Rubisco accumulation factor 1.1, chloroplastic n=1 Tax=Sesamum calycinum TaxID=2727403 RepID=A0AAW2LRV2_9LAMI